MRFYVNDDTNSLNIVQPITSASTLISSLTAQVKDYILSRFPKDLFKTVYIDTMESYSDQKMRDKYNSSADKIPYPSMSITPEITLDDPIGEMEKHLHLSSPNVYLRKDIRNTYKNLLIDPKNRVSIYYTSDYITTNFNFRITTNSFIQNADMAFFLKSKFQQGIFQFINNRHLQTEVPKTFIKILADILHLDINNSYEMDQLRLYVISTGTQDGMIEKKKNLMSGKECFFINERVNFLTVFNDLDCPTSVVREGQSEGEYTISFRLQVSTWLPNNFIMNIHKKTIDDLRCEINTDIEEQDSGYYSMSINGNSINSKSHSLILKKDAIEFKDLSGKTQIGQLVYDNIYTHVADEPIPTIELMPSMTEEFKKIHEYAINGNHKKIDLSSLIGFIVIDSEGYLDTKYYNIDYDKLTIKVSNKLNSDIGVAMYVNRALFETLKVARDKDKFYFDDGVLTSMIINDGCGNSRATIYHISDDVKDDTSLRIQTVYGTGYLKIKASSAKTDSYRICVGYDGDKPIIKKLMLK